MPPATSRTKLTKNNEQVKYFRELIKDARSKAEEQDWLLVYYKHLRFQRYCDKKLSHVL